MSQPLQDIVPLFNVSGNYNGASGIAPRPDPWSMRPAAEVPLVRSHSRPEAWYSSSPPGSSQTLPGTLRCPGSGLALCAVCLCLPLTDCSLTVSPFAFYSFPRWVVFFFFFSSAPNSRMTKSENVSITLRVPAPSSLLPAAAPSETSPPASPSPPLTPPPPYSN